MPTLTGARTNNEPTLSVANCFRSRAKGPSNERICSGLTLTYSGRGALYLIAQELKKSNKQVVLLPSFHCPTVVDPFLAAGFRVRYYEIDHELTINLKDFHEQLDDEVCAVLVVNYFGFPAQISQIVAACNKIGALLIEDCAHSFVAADSGGLNGERGDVAIFSFKKIVPSLVGGAIRVNRPGFVVNSPQRRAPLGRSLIDFKHLLEQLVNNLNDGFIKRAYNWLESIRVRLKSGNSPNASETGNPSRIESFEYPFDVRVATSKMPWIAKTIIEAADLSAVAMARRENFCTLLQRLTPSNEFRQIYDRLPDNVCPWGFPILLEDRGSMDLRLQSRGVPIFSFGETLHSDFERVFALGSEKYERTRALSSRLMVIAVHQDLGPSDFVRYAEIINDEISQFSKQIHD